jgi:hypothetical protein
MTTHISFPSIEQYRNVVKLVSDRCRFHNAPLPKLTFHGTVKLHGTNAAVGYKDGELWAQSRSHIITPEADNAGFARFVAERRDIFAAELNTIGADFGEKDVTVIAYGEWCGQGIMKGVAITQLPKMFVLFGVRVLTPDSDEHGTWLDADELAGIKFADPAIHNIEDFETWDIDIDFSFPAEQQNELAALTQAVEAECPVGKHFGVSGVGEGIVWRCAGAATDKLIGPRHNLDYRTEDLIFKVKGEKHSDSKVKVLVEVDLEKVKSVREFVETVVTDHRLEKGVDSLRQGNLPVAVESTGPFLKWVGGDVIKEESDRLEASGLDRKDVMGEVAKAARTWFMAYLNKEAGLE